MVDHGLRVGAGHGYDGDADVPFGHCFRHLRHRLHRYAADLLTHIGQVVVECGHQVETVGVEARVIQDGVAQPTNSNHGDVPFAVQAQDLLQLPQQIAHNISSALLAEPAEIRQVLSDLGRSNLKLLSQLLRVGHLVARVQ